MIGGRKGDFIGLLLLGSSVSKNRQFDEKDSDDAADAYANIVDWNYSLKDNDQPMRYDIMDVTPLSCMLQN
jgi:hypothetical protein